METHRRGLIVMIGLLLALTPPAYSGALRCRSDPAVILSNGTVLDLSADVDAMLWDISSVQYTVHVPEGVWAILVVRTPNWPGTKESFKIVSDAPAKVYDTTTLVKTTRRGVAVTANLLVNLNFASTRGSDLQPLRTTVTVP